MAEFAKTRTIRRMRAGARRAQQRLRRHEVRSQLALRRLALVIGVVTGYATILFRVGILRLEELFHGAPEQVIRTVAAHLPWYC